MLVTVKLRDLKSSGGISGLGRRRIRKGRAAVATSAERRARRSHRVAPVPLLAVDGAEGEAADRQRHDRGAQPVEARRRLLVAALLDVPQHRVEGQRDERDVDQEDGAPGDGVDQDAADEGPEQGRARGRAGPDPEGARPGSAR